jgi:hypothetical protein
MRSAAQPEPSTPTTHPLAHCPAEIHPSLLTHHNDIQSLAKHNRKPMQPIENAHPHPKSIASFCRHLARAPHLTNPHSPAAPFLFDTNKPPRITIPARALMKTKDKQFSIQYKFALHESRFTNHDSRPTAHFPANPNACD